MNDLTVIEMNHLTLDQCIQEWLIVKGRRSGSERTKEVYTNTISDFRNQLFSAGIDLDGNPVMIASLAQGFAGFSHDEKKNEVSAATHNQRLSVLSSFYRYAIKRRLVTINPVDYTERQILVTKNAARPLSQQVVIDAMASIDRTTPAGKRDYALLAILLGTGRRVSEVAALQCGDIQRQGKEMVVVFRRCKGGKQMIDNLPAPVTGVLFDYLASIYPNGPQAKQEPVWVSFSNRSKLLAISARTIERICLARLGTGKAHTTRHTWASTMKALGADIADIQRGLGHKSLYTTVIYLESLVGYENAHATALANAWGIG